MLKLRMRTKFLLSMLLISAGLTCTSLLLVRYSVRKQIKKEIFADLRNSVSTFQNFQREREHTLTHSAELISDLPILRELMTTEHEATIQDASSDLWRLAGSDLFVLTDRAGRVVALHTTSPGLTREVAQQSFADSFNDESSGHWWYGGQHLYEVFLKPIYFGPAAENRLLGFLAIGYEIDDRVAAQVRPDRRQLAGGVLLRRHGGEDDFESDAGGGAEPATRASHAVAGNLPDREQIQLGEERFLITSLELAARKIPPVRLNVLKSYDQATAFLDSLNHLLLALGLAAVLGGSALVFFISHTFTRPLANLVEGVRALEKGDFTYALDARGSDEAAEVTGAFNRMRSRLEDNATGVAGGRTPGHDRAHGQFHLARFAAFAGGHCGQCGISLRKPFVVRSARRALSGNSRGGEPDDRSHRFAAGVFAYAGIAAPDLRKRERFGGTGGAGDPSASGISPDRNLRSVSKANSPGWFDAKKLERAIYNLAVKCLRGRHTGCRRDRGGS